jgi:hypothetical protein
MTRWKSGKDLRLVQRLFSGARVFWKMGFGFG